MLGGRGRRRRRAQVWEPGQDTTGEAGWRDEVAAAAESAEEEAALRAQGPQRQAKGVATGPEAEPVAGVAMAAGAAAGMAAAGERGAARAMSSRPRLRRRWG
mmetsp:Transcript_35693/g.84573  ORF Transcript_35693/g.84573 Transcript_35693/m.84573 type:complete len:102 (+) Transcript_35693:2147-2452(+)